MPPSAPKGKGGKTSKFRSFKKKIALKSKARLSSKKSKPSKSRKSKNPSKGLKQKQRKPIEKKNRKDAKQRMRTRKSKYDKLKASVAGDPYLSLPEKRQKLETLRSDYINAQHNEIMKYRRRKINLRYAGRSYYSPYPYGGVLSEIAVGGLATTIISSTTSNTRPEVPVTPIPQPMGGVGPSVPPSFQPPVSNDQMDSPQEIKETPQEEKQFPYNDQEMRTLAHHNTVAGRCVRSLQMVKGGHLVAFLNARDDYMNERDPEVQITKGLKLMSIAKQLDTRYGTHAMAWGKVMRYRPPAWTREMAQMFADGADADEITEISKMSGSEITKHLLEMDKRRFKRSSNMLKHVRHRPSDAPWMNTSQKMKPSQRWVTD